MTPWYALAPIPTPIQRHFKMVHFDHILNVLNIKGRASKIGFGKYMGPV
jgi:hypothetical protein